MEHVKAELDLNIFFLNETTFTIFIDKPGRVTRLQVNAIMQEGCIKLLRDEYVDGHIRLTCFASVDLYHPEAVSSLLTHLKKVM